MFFTGLFVLRSGCNYPAAEEFIARDADGLCSRKANPGRMSECCVRAGARRHFLYRYGMAPGPRKGADILFPQFEAVVAAGALPGWQ